MHGNRGRAAPTGWAWRGHPFHPGNNINGIDAGVEGDRNTGKPHSLANPAVNEIQAAYIRKVVDTVNDLDNVLYEVINEGGEKEWDWWVVNALAQVQSAASRSSTRSGSPATARNDWPACWPARPTGSRRAATTGLPKIRLRGTARRSACSIRIMSGAWAAIRRGSGRVFCAATIRLHGPIRRDSTRSSS